MPAYALEIVALSDSGPNKALLSEKEMEKYGSFKIEKRRREWLGGRTALKLAVKKHIAPEMAEMDITAVPDKDGRPHLQLRRSPSPVPISLTHSGGYAVAAIGLGQVTAIGVDLEVAEKRSASWAKDCFTGPELEKAAGNALALTALWTRKEAALKALGLGLSVDLKEIDFSSGEPAYAGHLKELWKGLGSPRVHEETPVAIPPGYALSVAWTENLKSYGGN